MAIIHNIKCKLFYMIIKNFVEIVGESKTMNNEKLMQWLEGYGRVIKLQVYLIERLTDNTKNLK